MFNIIRLNFPSIQLISLFMYYLLFLQQLFFAHSIIFHVCNAVYIHRNDCRIEIMISSTWLMILWDLFRFSKNFSDLKESFCAICLMVCMRIRNLTLRKWFLVEISLIKSMNMKWFQHLPDYLEKQNDKIGIIASCVLGAF